MQADKLAIDRLTKAFYDAFTNRGVIAANVDSLYDFFLPQAIVTKNAGSTPEVYDLAGFVEPRRSLLCGGALVDFCEEEVFERTEILGNIAQRCSLYRKSWTASGHPSGGRGVKTMQFVRTPDGWKIASLAWDDEREGLIIADRLDPAVPIIETGLLRLRAHRVIGYGEFARAVFNDRPTIFFERPSRASCRSPGRRWQVEFDALFQR